MMAFQSAPESFGTYLLLTLFASSFFAYISVLVIYRLYFSPIAKFPGSKLTAALGWYEIYLDIVKDGQFTFQIEKWHKKYGPIIRINPTEIHVSDPDFYNVIYSSNTRFDKTEAFKYHLATPEASQATVKHDLHRQRRMALNPLLSKRQVLKFCPYIHTRAEKLCARLANEYQGTSKVINLNEAWGAYSTDIITYYVSGSTYNFLDYPDFEAPFLSAMKELTHSTHFSRHFPQIIALLQALPYSVQFFIQPSMRALFQFHHEIKMRILDSMDGKNEDQGHKSVLNGLYESNLPPEELTLSRLEYETRSIVAAGLDVVKGAMSLGSFHIIDNKDILQRLRQELMEAFPDLNKNPTLPELEKLPFLTAVILETLRLTYGVSQRMPRTSDQPLRYNDTYTIPASVPFSSTNYIISHNETIFPSSHSFLPSRWLPIESSAANRCYLVSFSKGTRMCAGMHLAYAELYIGLGTIFRTFDFDLVDTRRDSVDMARDLFTPWPKRGTKGVRVRVR